MNDVLLLCFCTTRVHDSILPQHKGPNDWHMSGDSSYHVWELVNALIAANMTVGEIVKSTWPVSEMMIVIPVVAFSTRCRRLTNTEICRTKPQ